MKTIKHKLRTASRALLAGALTCAALSLYPAPIAQASYTVSQCNASTGAGAPGWQVHGTGGFAALDVCPNFIQVTGLVNGVYTPAGYWRAWRTPQLPAGLTIDSVSYESIGAAQSGIGTVGGGLCTDGEPVNVFCAGDYLYYLPYQNQWIGRAQARPGSRFFKLLMACGAANCPRTTWTNGAVRNLTFQMQDSDGPSSGYAGDSGVDVWGGWTSGNKDVRVWSMDGSSGVDHADLTFDGNWSHPLRDVKHAPCARVAGGYASFVPCPSGAAMIHDVDTTQLSDGPHTLQHVTYDASGNAYTNAQSFRVDNTPPAEPAAVDLADDNAGGWQSVNDFDVSWSNTGEVAETATQSGIAKSCVDVGPAEGQAVDPAPACEDAATAARSDIQVPDDGQWSAEIWTVDRAGNASSKASMTLKLDTTIPERAPGRANGWIGLGELMDGKAQEWTRPSNAFTINSGICGYGFSVSPEPLEEAPTEINVFGNITSALIPANTPEGISWAHFRPISCAGLAGPTEHAEVKVDLTEPTSEVSGVPASGWTNAPGVVRAVGSDPMPGSGMTPADPGFAVTDGASVRFELNHAAVQEDRGGVGNFDTSGLLEGAHTLTVKTFDVARNFDEQTFALGIDKTAPTGSFAVVDPADPTVFRVSTSDALSGVTGGSIQYAPVDGDGNEGDFKPLATDLVGDQLVATFPDTKLPRGTYALRAVVEDRAGNAGNVTTTAAGQRMIITTPLRQGAGMQLAATKQGALCKLKRARTKAGKRRARKLRRACIRKRAQGNGSGVSVKARFGRALMLYGQLTDAHGRPIADQKIELSQRTGGGPARLVGNAVTNHAGQFAYKAPSGPSREVITYWPGTKTHQDVSASVRIGVPAKVTLRISPRTVHGQHKFVFSGKVFAQDGVSAAGKLVQLQFYNHLRRRWQAGPALVRAGKGGRFRYSYRIKRMSGDRETIDFRAFVPAEATWPYDDGVSPVKRLTHLRR